MSMCFSVTVRLCQLGTFQILFKCLQKQLVKFTKKILGYTCFKDYQTTTSWLI